MAIVLWAPKSHLQERSAHIRRCDKCLREYFQVPEDFACRHAGCDGVTWPRRVLRDMRVFCTNSGEPCLDFLKEEPPMTKRCLACRQPITRDRDYCQRHEPSPESLDDPLDLTHTVLGQVAIEALSEMVSQAPDVQAPEAPIIDTPDNPPDFGGFGGGDAGGGGAGGSF
jgi:hypothetical protein